MLKRQTEDTQVPWQYQPVQPVATPPAGRFDKDALQKILTTAAHLQKVEQDTLSQSEVESIAAEMGIAPQHVRQAIALSGQRTTKIHRLPYTGLSTRQKRLVVLMTLIYSALMGIVSATAPGSHSVWSELITFVYLAALFVLPLALIWLGTQLHYKRAGAVAGGTVTIVMYLSGLIAMLLFNPINNLEGEVVLNGVIIGCGYVGAGIVLSLGGAALHQWLVSRRLRHVAKPSDFDR